MNDGKLDAVAAEALVKAIEKLPELTDAVVRGEVIEAIAWLVIGLLVFFVAGYLLALTTRALLDDKIDECDDIILLIAFASAFIFLGCAPIVCSCVTLAKAKYAPEALALETVMKGGR